MDPISLILLQFSLDLAWLEQNFSSGKYTQLLNSDFHTDLATKKEITSMFRMQ